MIALVCLAWLQLLSFILYALAGLVQSTESSTHLQIAQVRRAYLLTNSLDMVATHFAKLQTWLSHRFVVIGYQPTKVCYTEINAMRSKYCLVDILADTPSGIKRLEMRLEQFDFSCRCIH